MALEEYLFRQVEPNEDLVMLWQNEPSVIIGRYQNTVEEINSEYIRENNVNVVRRMTGGGAVYHDLGNLNYSFITKKPDKDFDFHALTLPLVRALETIGITTELTGRNDVTIDGRKFSGNAQHIDKNRLLHHGTILYNASLDNVQKTLMVKADKIESKSIKSVRSRVCNISEYMKEFIPLKDFEEILLNSLFEGKTAKEYILSDEQLAEVNKLAQQKYRQWDWNYGNSPKCNVKKRRRLPAGEFVFQMWIEEGVIKELKISGDFFCKTDITTLEDKFVEVTFRKENLQNVLDEINIQDYFQNVTKQELLGLLLD